MPADRRAAHHRYYLEVTKPKRQAKAKAPPTWRGCASCGKAIKVLPGHRPRVYCTVTCQVRAWRQRQKG